mmetsp:Transcript_14883/g.44530  ORF Transcript_14883/g.44530 Transcript_14883/m.44530 type:complete len:213 (-) Transcript_14883:535-1173(-)
MQVVLERRAGEEQLALRLDGAQPLVEMGLLVLDAVAFVEDEVAPVDAVAEHRLHVGRRRHLVRRHDHVKVVHVREQLGAHQLPLLAVARVQPHDAQRGREALELVHPRREHREGGDHERWADDAARELEEAEEGDGLNGLAEAHLVGEDAVDALAVRGQQPVDAHHLVRLQRRLEPIKLTDRIGRQVAVRHRPEDLALRKGDALAAAAAAAA